MPSSDGSGGGYGGQDREEVRTRKNKWNGKLKFNFEEMPETLGERVFQQ